MSPRPRKNSTDVAGLYEKFDRRTGRVYYQYKNPVTGKFHGLGTDKGKAEKIASTANQRIAAAEAEYFMRKIDESPSATKRRGIRLKAWVCNFAFFSGLIDAQFWAGIAQLKSPELTAKIYLFSSGLSPRPFLAHPLTKNYPVVLSE